ncbi:hypothetical protein [Dyella kyungheensis]|jgi:hypothetical protein|uniref:DUF4239 domain-containing protein n=1 Tax=Dyella kyungheensis TaxID=1242174 RepID=A0ABS2JS29_9GAMM|nr:hypothetical protein [Dyella kyungheensis]MBM7121773.1 hypothetical protein [Dyella kyungheensis]
MAFALNHPLMVFVISFVVLWLAEHLGAWWAQRRPATEPTSGETFGVVQGATLTLLGLIIGFSFSMAISRYDQRKNYEEAEANAIGTEYVRLDLLPAADAAKLRPLLVSYLKQRIVFYETTDRDKLPALTAAKNQLQSNLWSAVATPAHESPNPLTALAVSGMNDVLNSEGYTQAAWWNRIPVAAWLLMAVIALGCNLLVGVGWRKRSSEPGLLLVLPLVVAVSFMLIADIDSPRGGLIRVSPQNLKALLATFPGA